MDNNAERWTVYKTSSAIDPWCAYNEFGADDAIEFFSTHEEAITYADRTARINQGENK